VCKYRALFEHARKLGEVAIGRHGLEQAMEMVWHEAVHNSFKPIIGQRTQKIDGRLFDTCTGNEVLLAIGGADR
jgi:hypothetical protein